MANSSWAGLGGAEEPCDLARPRLVLCPCYARLDAIGERDKNALVVEQLELDVSL